MMPQDTISDDDDQDQDKAIQWWWCILEHLKQINFFLHLHPIIASTHHSRFPYKDQLPHSDPCTSCITSWFVKRVSQVLGYHQEISASAFFVCTNFHKQVLVLFKLWDRRWRNRMHYLESLTSLLQQCWRILSKSISQCVSIVRFR